MQQDEGPARRRSCVDQGGLRLCTRCCGTASGQKIAPNGCNNLASGRRLKDERSGQLGAVAYRRLEIAVLLTLVTFGTLRWLEPLKRRTNSNTDDGESDD